MRNKNFRRGSGCYTCNSCKKLTRDTQGEGGCRLCLAGIDNYLIDNGREDTIENYGNEIVDTLKRRPELIDLFPDLSGLVAEKISVAKPIIGGLL